MKDKYQKLCEEKFFDWYSYSGHPNANMGWEACFKELVIPLLECVQFYSERYHFYPGTSDQSVKIYEEKYIDGKYEGDTFLCEKARETLKDLGIE